MKHPGFLFLLLILACPNVIAQLSHQTISSQLHSKQIGNYTIVGIVGQNSPTGTFKQSQATFLQGFLHYNMYSIENLDQFSQQTGISVYPNPFSSTINIAFPQAQKSIKVTFLDLTGRMIYSKSVNANDKTVSINMPVGLPQILYTVVIETENKTYNLKLLKYVY